MKQINLLPEDYKSNLKLERFLKGAIVVQAVAFFVLILIATIFSILSDSLHEKSVVYTEHLQSGKYLESEKLINDVKELSDKVESLEGLVSSIDVPDSLTNKDIQFVFSLLPPGVFASTVSFSSESNRVTFYGITEDNTNISMFVDALAASCDFAEIIIKNMTLTDKATTVSFTLEIYYLEEDVQ